MNGPGERAGFSKDLAYRRVAISQSNYIPWKGYFDFINQADVFILYDTAQFTKNDWRNRNRIKSPCGLAWLTIPVVHRFGQSVEETRIHDSRWAAKHWKTIVHSYARAAHFAELKDWAEALYQEAADQPSLSRVNHLFLERICRRLGIETPLFWSSAFRLAEGRTERLVELCRQVGASEYLSGPTGGVYLDPEPFARQGITLTFVDYEGYPEYRQLFPPFVHGVSILDLLFNEGAEATRFLKSFPPQGERQEPASTVRGDGPARLHDCRSRR